MLKKGILKLFLITFVFSYIIVTLYNGGANEVIQGYNILFNAPIEQQGQNTILNINEFRREPSLPILFADMTAVTWENGVEKEVQDPLVNPEKWYDYYAGRMANAKTKDGSYWVWIPRFSYRITYYTDSSQNNIKGYYTDKGFVGSDMETMTDESAVKTPYWKMEKEFVPNHETLKSKGFRIHEAFGKGGTQRKGFWISKYMIGTDGRFAPNNTISKSEQLYQAFYNIDRMVRDNNQYGLDYTMQHTSLPRNTEYGALYYLTGLANTNYSPNTTSTSDIANSSSATFGNETGVYDLNNGVREWTADIASNNFKTFEDKLKELYRAEYGVDTLFMQKDENGLYKDKLSLIGKIKLVYDKIVTSGSNKNYGEGTLEFMTDYASKDAAPYGGRSILPGRNNLYNTRTSDISAQNKSIFAYEGVESNPGNIGYRAVIYAYNPEGAEIITPRTDIDSNTPGKAQTLLEKNKGKYVKITFKSQKKILELMSKGYTSYGNKEATFYIPKGSRFPLNLWAGTRPANYDSDFRTTETEYRFLGWDINPQGREFYKDTVITEKTAQALIRYPSSESSSGPHVYYEPYKDKKYKANLKVIDEDLGYMHNFGEMQIGTTIAERIGKVIPRMPGYSTDFKDDKGKKIETYFMPAPSTSRIFTNDLVLTTLMNKEEWLKYKTVTYYIESPNKQVIGQELVITGNKPLGLDNVNLPEGKRLVGWSPSLDTVVTDNMEIKAILEDTPRPAGNVVELTANLDGGKSTLMQNGEKLYISQGTRLSDPVNASELSRIRATVPTKLGYKFKGWSVSENEPLNGNMEIRAIWEREKVRATFTAPGSDTNYNESSVIDAGTAPNAPLKNPERKGFRFNGWTPNVSLPIYSDTTYTADWVKKDESGENQEHPSNGDNDKKDNNGENNNENGNNGGNNNGGNNNGNGNNGGNNPGDDGTGHTIFPNLPDNIKIYDPKYDNISQSDYDESTVKKGRTRIIFDLDGEKWRYPVVFEVDNGTLFLTYVQPSKDGYQFVGWEPDWKASTGGIIKYKAKWLRKEVDNNNSGNNGNNSGNNNNNSENNNNNGGNNSGGNNSGRYIPNGSNNNGNNNGNGNNGGTTNQYIYNGRVLTGDPNNNSTNIFNSRNVPGTNNNNPSGRGIGLTGINGNNGGTYGTTIPKVDKDLPKSGESNIKAVIGIFAISILCGVMYIYQNKLRKITRKSRKK